MDDVFLDVHPPDLLLWNSPEIGLVCGRPASVLCEDAEGLVSSWRRWPETSAAAAVSAHGPGTAVHLHLRRAPARHGDGGPRVESGTAVRIGRWVGSLRRTGAGQRVVFSISELYELTGDLPVGELLGDVAPSAGTDKIAKEQVNCDLDVLWGGTLARLFYDRITGTGDGRAEFTPAHRSAFTGYLEAALTQSNFCKTQAALSRCVARLPAGGGLLVRGGRGLELASIRMDPPDMVGSNGEVIFEAVATGERPAPAWRGTLYAELAEALIAEARGLWACQEAVRKLIQRDAEFLARLDGRNALCGTAAASAFAVQRKTASELGSGLDPDSCPEIWLSCRLPPFMIETGSGGAILDYSQPEDAASVVIRLREGRLYPALCDHDLSLHAHTSNGWRVWAHYPNVMERPSCALGIGGLCCNDGPDAALLRARDNGHAPGQFLKALLQVGHDAVMLGYRASNSADVYHHPALLIEEAHKNGKQSPYRVLSRSEAEQKARQGTIFVPHAR